MIRRLDAGDTEAYRALRLQALRTDPVAFSSAHADEAAQPSAFFAARMPNTFGCFVDDALVGSVGLIVAPGEKVRHRGTIVGMYVRQEHRGHGHARQLMAFAIATARAAGLSSVRLAVTVGNAAAEALYRELGFRPYGVEPDAIRVDGIRYDETLMLLDLPS
jgi:ribosomal protein S18 acetylase RimI-like enzyme